MKYKLLKDLPHFKAGFILDEDCIPKGLEFLKELDLRYCNKWFEPVIERWRADAKNDEYISQYYCLRSCGETFSSNDSRGIYDQKTFDYGNYFRTADQAEEASKRIKKCLMEYHKELGE